MSDKKISVPNHDGQGTALSAAIKFPPGRTVVGYEIWKYRHQAQAIGN